MDARDARRAAPLRLGSARVAYWVGALLRAQAAVPSGTAA
jgi:hypothetical protein